MTVLDFNEGPPTATPAITHAIRYAEQGTPVFPCSPATKRPLTQHGFKEATTDLFQIRKWWQAHPNAMIGAPTGSRSGWWVLDIDTDETRGKQGLQSLASMGHDLSELMDTVVNRTASGGYHVFFKFDPSAPITNARGSLPIHIDVRGEGGYVIMSGSTLSDGRPYAWINPPEEIELEEAPQWLLDAIRGPSPTADVLDFNTAAKVASSSVVERVLAAEPGTWHERTRDLVARMVSEGASDDTIRAIAPQFTEAGYTNAQTIAEFMTHARTAREKWGHKSDAPTNPNMEPPKPSTDRKRLPILSRSDMRDREAPEYLVDEVITEKSVMTVYGPSGSLKSFVAIDIGMAVAHGVQWHGRDVKQGTVVYVTGEGTSQIGHRLDAWDIANQTEGVDAPFHLVPLGVPISDPTWVSNLIADIEDAELQPVMIWLDTLARTFGQGDENSQKDMNAYISGVDRLKEHFGAVVGIVHHTGKDSDKGLRGSSALYAAMDTVIKTDRKTMTVTLKNQQPHGKQKDGAEFDDIALEARVIKLNTVDNKGRDLTSLALFECENKGANDGDEDAPWDKSERPVVAMGANQKAIIKALKQAKGEPLGFTRLVAMAGLDGSKARQAIIPLVEKGMVLETGEEGVKRWTLV